MARVATKCAYARGSNQSAPHSRGIVLATSTLVILTNKHILNGHLVQIILEQEGQVVIIRKSSNKHHGGKFIK